MEQRATTYAPRSAAHIPGLAIGRPIIGRETDLIRVRTALVDSRSRLLTLLGPSGVGKTRLAIEAGRELQSSFPGGVHFVDLSPLTRSEEVSREILRRIGVDEAIASALPEVLCHLGTPSSSVLLILDNFEHVLNAAPLVGELLQECDHIQVLVTSQARLRISSETVLDIAPLTLPTNAHPSRADLDQAGATMLFLERARAVRASFAADDHDAADVAEICRNLDGIPLAIELAASRANLLTPNALLLKLQESLLALENGDRDRPKRHQQLRSAIRWSYSLLEEPERIVFRRLSLFRGGFDLESVENIVGQVPGRNMMTILGTLVDKSFLRPAADWDDSGRFGLLRTIREFGEEELGAAGERLTCADRHLNWFLDLAEQGETGLVGPEAASWYRRMAAEQPNFRAALAWAVDKEDAESSQRLASALWRFWVRGGLEENRSWLLKSLALKTPSPTSVRAKACHALGNCELDLGNYGDALDAYQRGLSLIDFAIDRREHARGLNGIGLVNFFRGDYEDAERNHRHALAIRRIENDPIGLGNSLTNLGDVLLATGKLDEAESLHREALEIRMESGDLNAIAYSIYNLGLVAEQRGRYDRALLLMQEALGEMEESGDLLGTAYALATKGNIEIEIGDLPSAARTLKSALEIRRSLGDQRGSIECIEQIGVVLALQGQTECAARLFGAAAAHRKRLNAPMPPATQVQLDRCISTIELTLAAGVFSDLMFAGGLMTQNAAATMALDLVEGSFDAESGERQSTNASNPVPEAMLSMREVEVLRLAARGLTDQNIADQLFMSRRTATTHQSNIRRKLDVQNRAEAVAKAIHLGIISPAS